MDRLARVLSGDMPDPYIVRSDGNSLPYSGVNLVAPPMMKADVDAAIAAGFTSDDLILMDRDHKRFSGLVGEKTLQEDFLFQPEVQPSFNELPASRYGNDPFRLASDCFFFADSSLKMLSVEDATSSSSTLISGSSAGNYFCVVEKERFAPGTKSTPSVLDDIKPIAEEFMKFVAGTDTKDEILQYMEKKDKQHYFDARLLERLALSDNPKSRSVYDVSFLVNIVLYCFSQPLKTAVLAGQHPMMLSIEPIRDAASVVSGIGRSVVLEMDIEKCDKHIRHWQVEAYVHQFVKQFSEEQPTHAQMANLLICILNYTRIATPWHTFYRRGRRLCLSGANFIQGLESFWTLVVVFAAQLQVIRTWKVGRVWCLHRIGILADNGHLEVDE